VVLRYAVASALAIPAKEDVTCIVADVVQWPPPARQGQPVQPHLVMWLNPPSPRKRSKISRVSGVFRGWMCLHAPPRPRGRPSVPGLPDSGQADRL
jgi:hypothetical protein